MKLVRTAKGKETLVLEGSRTKLNNRLKELRSATRGGVSGQRGKKYPVRYEIRE